MVRFLRCREAVHFCANSGDIRILPDNNRPHNKSPQLVVEELDYMCRLGIRQVLLACDNFIGDPRWANEVADALIEWQGAHRLSSELCIPG